LVVSIAPGVDNTFIPGSRFTGSVASFKTGYPYGVIIGNVIPRSPMDSALLIQLPVFINLLLQVVYWLILILIINLA
jgi:hypothetical protein